MFFIPYILFLLISSYHCHIIKTLNEITVDEELPIGSMVTHLTDKIPNLEQSSEFDLVTPLSNEFDLFSIDHNQFSLMVKNRIDYEDLCLKRQQCILSVSIAVSNDNTIHVYLLPIRILNKNDNTLKFNVNRTVIEIDENDESWSRKNYPLPRAYDDDGDLIVYSIYLQNWTKPDGLFEFDEHNLLLKPLKKFDREEQNIYVLRLIAHNEDDASSDVIIVIKDVNDNQPICQQNQTLFLISNTSIISKFQVKATDRDEGDNGNLEYSLVNSLPGFSIDRYNGVIKFDYNKWIRSNETLLIINVNDHGKPLQLSTKCFIEIQLTFLYEIRFRSNFSFINETNIYIDLQSTNSSLGHFVVHDQQYGKTCYDCFLNVSSSMDDIVYFNHLTYDLYLNLHSRLLMRMLTNYKNNKENISFNLDVQIRNFKTPSAQTKQTYLFTIHFNKLNLLIKSNVYFLKIYDNILLNERISIFNAHHHCLNGRSDPLMLTDSTETFDIDQKFNLILKKYLSAKRQHFYQLTIQQRPTNSTNHTNSCSIQIRLYVLDPYSNDNLFPHFNQSFYILTSKNLSYFSLPLVPSHVEYTSSVPELISIDSRNRSLVIRSASLYLFNYYDFRIQAIDKRVPSLSSSIPIRIFFGDNKYSPYLLMNSTKQSVEVMSSRFLYQIKAFDPDIIINNETNLYLPSVEYEIDSSVNLEIERFTGRVFLKSFNTTKINFTLIIKDFGQPNRLVTRHTITFDIKSNDNMLLLILFITILTILLFITVLKIVKLILNNYWINHEEKIKTRNKSSWQNSSPTTPDTCLIDNEYMTSPIASLPRTSSGGEQRIYPTFSYVHVNNDGQQPRKLVSHSSLDKINFHYPSDRLSLKQTYQQRLSMTDINKYLERFEKLYNDSSSQQYLHQPIGSVV